MKNSIPSFLSEKSPANYHGCVKERFNIPFIEKGINELTKFIRTNHLQYESAAKKGLFQEVDPRIKILSVLFFTIIVTLKKTLLPEFLIFILVFLLTLISRLNISRFYKRVFILGFFFGFIVSIPAAFNLITHGEIIFPLITLSKPYNIWIYHIPAKIGITREGIWIISMLTLRVVNSLSLSLLVLYTTPFPDIIKALKAIRVPDSFLIIITLSYNYIFIFSKTIKDMYLAKKSRLINEVSSCEARKWITGRIAFTFRKSFQRYEDVLKAMHGRGFSGTIVIYSGKEINRLDRAVAAVALLTGILLLWN